MDATPEFPFKATTKHCPYFGVFTVLGIELFGRYRIEVNQGSHVGKYILNSDIELTVVHDVVKIDITEAEDFLEL